MRNAANRSQSQEVAMIVLTTGPASLARLMRREEPSQNFAPRQVRDHQRKGDQSETAAEPQRRL